jgi:hypothetical protein
MALSRAYLSAMQESTPALSDAEHLELLREMRADQLRLARSWRDIEPAIIWQGHLKAARALQADIKALKSQMAYAEIDSIMGDEPIRQTDYDDLAENMGRGSP